MTEKFKPFEFKRHALGDDEIKIEILYAGICHSDLHHVKSDWGKEEFKWFRTRNCGRVSEVGKNVTKFKSWRFSRCWLLVNSCRHYDFCKANLEQYCKKMLTYTTRPISQQ
ncbi:MAG: alcohol dehydrogenase catalytic domain-containing protein [Saprospiraceae bacterium]|nr:alcohol dehydrogenase catalytic domain-containing protein [Saprospiraceae bacterium]